MGSILISVDDESGVYELPSGLSVAFGRREPGGALALGGGACVVAGHIRALDDYWLMTNESRCATYCVDNLEGAGEYVRVRPRRPDVPIPFELSQVMLEVPCRHRGFTVFAPERANSAECGAEDFLDETSRYFMVLVCLCEPRLRDCRAVIVPTAGQISQRLSAFGDNLALTRSAVNYHIDYLAEKLDVPKAAGKTRTWKREALATLALKFDLVRSEHLNLLPRPVRAQCAVPAPPPGDRKPAALLGPGREFA
jgi:hypothetical protein